MSLHENQSLRHLSLKHILFGLIGCYVVALLHSWPQFSVRFCFYPWQRGTVCAKTNQGELEGKTQEKRFKNGCGIFWELSRREICVKFLGGAVNHRPKFFAQISRQISHKLPHPEKQFFAHNFAPDFAPVLAQPAGFPLSSLGAFEAARKRSSLGAQTCRNTPSSFSHCVPSLGG